jgi:hypothetical protein
VLQIQIRQNNPLFEHSKIYPLSSAGQIYDAELAGQSSSTSHRHGMYETKRLVLTKVQTDNKVLRRITTRKLHHLQDRNGFDWVPRSLNSRKSRANGSLAGSKTTYDSERQNRRNHVGYLIRQLVS